MRYGLHSRLKFYRSCYRVVTQNPCDIDPVFSEQFDQRPHLLVDPLSTLALRVIVCAYVRDSAALQ